MERRYHRAINIRLPEWQVRTLEALAASSKTPFPDYVRREVIGPFIRDVTTARAEEAASAQEAEERRLMSQATSTPSDAKDKPRDESLVVSRTDDG